MITRGISLWGPPHNAKNHEAKLRSTAYFSNSQTPLLVHAQELKKLDPITFYDTWSSKGETRSQFVTPGAQKVRAYHTLCYLELNK